MKNNKEQESKKRQRSPNQQMTESQKELIETLADKGMSDSKIAKQMGFSLARISILTTKYWKRKMENKTK